MTKLEAFEAFFEGNDVSYEVCLIVRAHWKQYQKWSQQKAGVKS